MQFINDYLEVFAVVGFFMWTFFFFGSIYFVLLEDTKDVEKELSVKKVVRHNGHL